MAKVVAVKTQAKLLNPGDLYSGRGPEFWDTVMDRALVGEPVYVKTNVPSDDPEEEVFKIIITDRRTPDVYYGRIKEDSE